MSEPFEYLQRRVEKELQWHDSKAARNKHWFYFVEITTLVAGTAIPVVNLWFTGPDLSRLLSGILGGVIVVAAGIGKLFKFQENWLQYRTLAEALGREAEFYKTGSADYAAADEAGRNRLLVERAENILAGSVSQFIATHRADQDRTPAKADATPQPAESAVSPPD
jgi:uncharacterized membrane protein